MVKLVEGLTGDFRAGWMKPRKKSVENPPDRLLFPEKIYSKQSCQLVKKLCRLHRFEKEKGSVHPIYVNTVMLPFVLHNVGKNIQRKFCDNNVSNKCYLLCI